MVSLALLALASQAGVTWARHWPLGLIALSIFILLRSDAEDSWPLGHLGFWEGMLSNDAILLHRLGTLVACVLGLIEWRVRVNSKPSLHMPYVIPMLCAAGGALFGHSHVDFQAKEEYWIHVTHSLIGMPAVAMACGRWLELRLTPPTGRLVGFVFASAMLLVGLILLFYPETPVS